jgi:dipeptidase E
MMQLLLLSNSTSFGRGYLDHAMDAVLDFLGPVRRLLFVPFALHDRSGYTQKARERFAREGVEVAEATPDAAGLAAVEAAEAVFVGGGNTFRLLDALQRSGLLDALRARALGGMPYMGASAGTNIAAATIRTTNDMPIVQPRSFEALGLVPFQINPHYVDPPPDSQHMGETRETRLREYLEENEAPVLGIREGTWLRLDGTSLRLEGDAGGRLFRRGSEPEQIAGGTALDALLAG